MDQDKPSLVIDPETRKGQFCDGFAIRSNGKTAVIDFVFNTPDRQSVVVSRMIMTESTIKKLGELILEDKEGDNKNVSKEKAPKK